MPIEIAGRSTALHDAQEAPPLPLWTARKVAACVGGHCGVQATYGLHVRCVVLWPGSVHAGSVVRVIGITRTRVIKLRAERKPGDPLGPTPTPSPPPTNILMVRSSAVVEVRTTVRVVRVVAASTT